MAAERIVLAITKFPLAIFIALVACDDDHHAVQPGRSNRFEHMGRADALVWKVSSGSIYERRTMRLRGQVENDLGPDASIAEASSARSRMSHSISLSKMPGRKSSCRFGWVGAGRLRPQTEARELLEPQ